MEELRSAVQEELDGPGKDLGSYRAMHNKIRQVHELNVPRHKVHNVMYELDPAGLENRALAKKLLESRASSPREEQIGCIPLMAMQNLWAIKGILFLLVFMSLLALILSSYLLHFCSLSSFCSLGITFTVSQYVKTLYCINIYEVVRLNKKTI